MNEKLKRRMSTSSRATLKQAKAALFLGKSIIFETNSPPTHFAWFETKKGKISVDISYKSNKRGKKKRRMNSQSCVKKTRAKSWP